MNTKGSQTGNQHHSTLRCLPLLERATGLSLISVLLTVGWMISVAYQPSTLRLANPDLEVVVVLCVLGLTLALVSTVALLQTWKKP